MCERNASFSVIIEYYGNYDRIQGDTGGYNKGNSHKKKREKILKFKQIWWNWVESLKEYKQNLTEEKVIFIPFFKSEQC